MIIRDEQPGDAVAIGQTIHDAFESAEHSSGTEDRIVDALRNADALTLSLVAIEDGEFVGHVAISPVTIDGASGWYGLGPVAVRPERQGEGAGSALIGEALDRLRKQGASGCVVLGDPEYYGRFGFAHDPGVTYADVPPPYFQILSFGPECPKGAVSYHGAFDS
jgi:putative acetyltransferase